MSGNLYYMQGASSIAIRNFYVQDPDWAGSVKMTEASGKVTFHVPRISMSLGRLQKLGLVKTVGVFESGRSKWSLTNQGIEFGHKLKTAKACK